MLYIVTFLAVFVAEKVIIWYLIRNRQADFFINNHGIFNLPIHSQLIVVMLLLGLAGIWFRTKQQTLPVLGIALIFIGGFSNLLDRWLYGGVVDYWHVTTLTFNLADLVIATGALLLVILLIKRPT